MRMHRLAFALGLLAAPAAAQDKATIAVVNYPLAYFAERLGGEAVEVLFPVAGDTDPAFWRPGIADIAAIQGADLIALNGAGFAQWTTKASLPRSRLVDTSADFSDAYIKTETVTHSHGDDGEHSHTGTATYTWLDFDLAAFQAEALSAAMARRVPAAGDGLDARLAELKADLEALDAQASEVGATLEGRTIIATHPRYQYFAKAYGLEVASLEWAAGEMPSAAEWEDLAALLEGSANAILIWETDPPEEALQQASELGATNVVFPPLAARPADGDDFVAAMTSSLQALGATAQ